jgi:aminoglycoside phosphotransferase (APT) family kinase protein
MSGKAMSNEAFFDQPGDLRERDGFDGAALLRWFRDNVGPAEGVDVEQFGRGWSNLTYAVRFGDRELVLRRSPPNVKIIGGHDMGREHRILTGLAGRWPKVPKPVAFCEDPNVIGTPFYLMERVRGIVLRPKNPKKLLLTESKMRGLSEAMVDTLAEMHQLDWRAAGLGDLGKPEGYVKRQIQGWADRYRAAQTDDVIEFEELHAWLDHHAPPDTAQPALIHNDFKYDNVVIDSSLSRIEAVLDWEMATIGDPLMDLGTMLGYWVDPDDPAIFQVMCFGPTNIRGNLSRVDIASRYAKKTGRDVKNILFYYTYALYKLAVVAQQLYKRYKEGHTHEERYAMMLAAARAVTRCAVFAIEKGRIDRLAE